MSSVKKSASSEAAEARAQLPKVTGTQAPTPELRNATESSTLDFCRRLGGHRAHLTRLLNRINLFLDEKATSDRSKLSELIAPKKQAVAAMESYSEALVKSNLQSDEDEAAKMRQKREELAEIGPLFTNFVAEAAEVLSSSLEFLQWIDAKSCNHDGVPEDRSSSSDGTKPRAARRKPAAEGAGGVPSHQFSSSRGGEGGGTAQAARRFRNEDDRSGGCGGKGSC